MRKRNQSKKYKSRGKSRVKSLVKTIKNYLRKSSRKSRNRSLQRRSRTSRKSDKFYCGNKKKHPTGYSRVGTRYECMKKGFGAGSYSEKERIIEYLKDSGYKL
jgi:hypothetical protein